MSVFTGHWKVGQHFGRVKFVLFLRNKYLGRPSFGRGASFRLLGN